MDKLGDIARITPLDKSVDADLPDVDDPEALEGAAKLVHSFLRTKISPVSIARRMDGQPGHEWQGRILYEVVYKIWPRLYDRVLVDKEESRTRSGALLDYMVRCGIIRPLQRTYGSNPAKWWVSDHFTPMTVTHVSAPAADDNVSEEIETEIDQATEVAEKTEAEGVLPCRQPECSSSFTAGQARSGHEYINHNMVARADGERFYYNADDFTPQYVADSVMEVLEATKKPLTFYGICSVAYDKDPRLGKPVIRGQLGELVNKGTVTQFQRGSYTYFTIRDEDVPAGSLVGPVTTVTEKKEERKVAEATETPAEPGDLKSGIELARLVAVGALGSITAVQEAIEKIATYAAEKDREIASLKMRLTAAPKVSDREKELEAELERVKAERDLYKDKVETFESALRLLRTT